MCVYEALIFHKTLKLRSSTMLRQRGGGVAVRIFIAHTRTSLCCRLMIVWGMMD